MGSTTSKPTETKVFTPTSRVEYSQNLIGQLDSSIETDYTRSQYKEKYLQDEVNKRLAQASKESLAKLDKTLADSLLKEDTEKDSNLSHKSIDEKIAKLSNILNEKNSNFLTLSDDLIKSKEQVKTCLLDNKKHPLNCWEEVENFQKLVNSLK